MAGGFAGRRRKEKGIGMISGDVEESAEECGEEKAGMGV